MAKLGFSLVVAALAVGAAPIAANAATRGSYVANPAAQLGSAANPIPENSPTPAPLAYRITPDDPAIVTNGPIPDTAANRARYGEPISHAGRLSSPAGN
jgi:hypothetical protein